MKSQRAINSFSKGIDRDTSVNKYSDSNYYDALNMRLITDDPLTSGAMTNIPGNSLQLAFALEDVIIGTCKIRNTFNDTDKDSVVFFATNASGYDSIYLLEVNPDRIDTSSSPINLDHIYQEIGTGTTAYRAGYLYRGTDLNFSEDNRIKSESRYESALIRKIYWVDGINPIRHLNISTAESLILGGDTISSANIFEINPDVLLTTPTTEVISGGAYTAGIVQHAYQLYVKNGTKSVYSPLSNPINLSSNNFVANSYAITGNDLNVNTGNAVQVNISSLDTDFDRIRIVAVHYTQIGLSPTVNIIGEYEYSGDSITVIDTGGNTYGTIEINEFRLQGQIDYYADSLASKNNMMFYANLKEDVWNPTWLDPDDPLGTFYDTRAVRFAEITNSVSGSDTVNTTFQDTSPTSGADYMTSEYINTQYIRLTILDFKTWGFIPSARTVTSIDSIDADMLIVQYHLGGSIRTYVSSPGAIIPVLSGTVNVPIITIQDTSGIFDAAYNPATDYIDFAIFFNSDPLSSTFTYSYTSIGGSTYVADVYDTTLGKMSIDTSFSNWGDYGNGSSMIGYTHDGINIYNDIDNDEDDNCKFIYQSNTSTIGADGPNVAIEFETEELLINDISSNVFASVAAGSGVLDSWHRSSARTEVYRIYLVFYNTKMQYTNPQWVCDLRMPSINDSTDYSPISTSLPDVSAVNLYPKVTLKSVPSDPDLIGWQVFRCERGSGDRSVLATGLISKMGYDSTSGYYQPYSTSTAMLIKAEDSITDTERLIELISPEINFNKNLSFKSGDKLRVDGRYNGSLSKSTAYGALKLTSMDDRDASDNMYIDIRESNIEETQYADVSDVITRTYMSITYRNWMTFSSGAYNSQKGTTGVVNLSSDLGMSATTTGYGYGSYVRNVFETQYGGYTYEARSYNTVIPYSNYTPIATTTSTCYNGDTFIGYFAHLRGMIATALVPPTNRFEDIVLLPVESSINMLYRSDPVMTYFSLYVGTHSYIQEHEVNGIETWPTSYPTDIGDLYRYNSAYSSNLNGLSIQCQVFDSIQIEENPFKIIATDKKINNEYSDSWLILRPNNYLELDGKYGDINNVINFGNKFFAFQNKGVSIVSINDRSLIQDSTGISLTLGTGDVLARYDYLTTSSGITNGTDIVASNKALYYIDRSDKIIYHLLVEGDVPISEVMGLRSFMKEYDNITDIRTGFDPEYKEVLFYITDGVISNTIVMNEYINAFVSRYSFYPEEMYDVNDHFYSVAITPTSTVARAYRHNVGNYGQFYGDTLAEIYDSFVDMIINPNGVIIDKYDTIDLRLDLVDSTGSIVPHTGMTSVEASNSYQSITKTIGFSDSIVVGDALEETAKNLIRKWRVWLLPDSATLDFYRLTDAYLRLKIVRDNSFVLATSITCDSDAITVDSSVVTADMISSGTAGESYRFTLHDVTTFYRPTRN